MVRVNDHQQHWPGKTKLLSITALSNVLNDYLWKQVFLDPDGISNETNSGWDHHYLAMSELFFCAYA